MSFILDALRRAERERSHGHAPRVEDITGAAAPAPAPKGSRLPLISAAAIVVCAVLGATASWYWPRPPRSAEPEPVTLAAAGVRDAPVVMAAAPAPASARGETVASMDDLVQASEEEVVEEEIVEDIPEEPMVEEYVPEEPYVEEPMEQDPGMDPGDEVVDEPLATDEEPQPAPRQTSPFGAQGTAKPAPPPDPAAEPAPAAVDIAPAPITPPPAPGVVTKLRDMPSSYRSDFPKFKVDVHVYEDKSARRFVMINMRRYKEGERIDGGAQIVEIVAQGIVFEFRGQHVLYTLNR